MKFDPGGDVEYQLARILNEGIELDDNVRGAFLEIETLGVEQEVIHNLGFTPNGFIVILKDQPGDVWATRLTDWNSTSLFLTSNVSSATVRLFVL